MYFLPSAFCAASTAFSNKLPSIRQISAPLNGISIGIFKFTEKSIPTFFASTYQYPINESITIFPLFVTVDVFIPPSSIISLTNLIIFSLSPFSAYARIDTRLFFILCLISLNRSIDSSLSC